MSILTEAERRYDAERDGSAYAKADQFDYEAQRTATFQKLDVIAARVQSSRDSGHENILLGHIDGCEVRAEYMPDDPDEGNGELAAAKVTWQGITIATDGDSYLSLPMDGGFVGDMEIAQWAVIKRVAHTDIPERLIALAQRYPTYQSTLVASELERDASAICIVRDVCDDSLSPNFGREIGTDYMCGESLIHFPDSGEPPTLITYDTERCDGNIERDLNDLITLLNSPEVQAARAPRCNTRNSICG